MFVAGDIRREASCLVRRGASGCQKERPFRAHLSGRGRRVWGQRCVPEGADLCCRAGFPLLPRWHRCAPQVRRAEARAGVCRGRRSPLFGGCGEVGGGARACPFFRNTGRSCVGFSLYLCAANCRPDSLWPSLPRRKPTACCRLSRRDGP